MSMFQQVDEWIDHRTGYKGLIHEALFERIPGGARWRYVWGSTLVFTFVVQMITGFFLWTAYSPNSQGAWESVYYIQHEMPGGWLLRGVHHYTAQVMIVLLALHLMQVVIDGAYKAPREFNFWIGLILMKIVLALSLTGYLLPWDQKGYWATRVATNIAGITPVAGPELQRLVVGGSEYGHHTLTRFFALHAGLLPATLIGFLVLHIYVFRRLGITPHHPDSKPDAMFWPDQVLRDAVACLAVLAVVLGLVFLPSFSGGHPGAHLSAPADPGDQYSAARPEWYFLSLFQLLKYFPGESEIIGTHVLPGLAMLVLFLMPFIGKWKMGHKFNVGFLLIMVLGVVALTVIAMQEDNADPAYIAAKEEAEVVAQRSVELAGAWGIGSKGAVDLVRNDPLTEGPRLFARNCAACHRYDGHDGAGHGFADDQPATAADLGNFGSRKWVKSVLLDYAKHFADLKNAAPWDGEDVGAAFLEDGSMVAWSESNREVLTDTANAADVSALVEFIVAESQRDDLAPFDDQLVARGKEIFSSGELASGSFDSACTDCHSVAISDDEMLGEPGSGPTLTGYGGVDWLTDFVSDPGSEDHYGSATLNAMPAFGGRLSSTQLSLLVRWMAGDYYKSASPAAPAE